MISATLLRVAKEASKDLPINSAIAMLAISSAISTHNIKKRKKEFKQMGIKFKAIKQSLVNPDTGVASRGLKVTEYNFIELANFISATNTKGKDAEAIVHVDKAGDESNHRISVPTRKGPRIAKVGDVVVRVTVPKVILPGGLQAYHEYYVIKADEFTGYAK